MSTRNDSDSPMQLFNKNHSQETTTRSDPVISMHEEYFLDDNNECDRLPQKVKKEFFKWNQEACERLIKEVDARTQALVSPFLPSITFWNSIKGAMNSSGYELASSQCKNKWQNLTKQFKNLLNNNELNMAAKSANWIHFAMMYKMHIKVQNFTKKKKDPTNLDQTCNKTYYEVKLMDETATPSQGLSTIDKTKSSTADSIPKKIELKRSLDQEIPTERMAITTQTFKIVPPTPFNRHIEKSQAHRVNYHKRQLLAEDPEATVNNMEITEADITIIDQYDSDPQEEEGTFGGVSNIEQKNFSSSSDIQIVEPTKHSTQIISSSSQENNSTMIEPLSIMNASSFTKSQMENNSLIGNLISKPGITMTKKTDQNKILSNYMVTSGVTTKTVDKKAGQYKSVEPPNKKLLKNAYFSPLDDSDEGHCHTDIPRQVAPQRKRTITAMKATSVKESKPLQYAQCSMPSPILRAQASPEQTPAQISLDSPQYLKHLQNDPPKWFMNYIKTVHNPQIALIQSKLDVVLDKMVTQQKVIDNFIRDAKK